MSAPSVDASGDELAAALKATAPRKMFRTLLKWTLRSAVLAAVVAAALGWPASLGGKTSYSIVSGHSMNPTYHTGDLVVLRAQRTYRVGQIVVYRVPAGEPASGQYVVHRIVGGSNVTGFVTRGDNNSSVDIWTPHNIDIQGAAIVLLPKAGWVLRQGRDPLLYALLGGLYCGRLLWPRRKSSKPAGVDLRKAPKQPAEAACEETGSTAPAAGR
jgi:signal peptidase I